MNLAIAFQNKRNFLKETEKKFIPLHMYWCLPNSEFGTYYIQDK